MSANRDDPENRSGHASVHTNPANNQPVTSTSIHGQATGGNYGSYSRFSKMSANREDPTTRSGKAGVRTNPANYQPITSTSFHGRNTFGQNIPHDSDNSSDFDVWEAPNISDVNPEQVAIPKVRSAGGVFQKAWKDFHVSIKRKADMKILEQCSCKESDLPPVKMQYLLNFHFKELETALCDELLKLKWNVKCVKPGNQCLSIEVKNYTDESVLENVILLLSDELYKVNYFQSMQASKHPELLLKEYIDRGYLAIYVDDEKVFVVGVVDNPKKVTEMLRKKPTSSDYSSTSAYKMDVQLDNPFKCRLLIYLQFLPTMRQKHPSVNVAMDEERSIMSICGNNLVDVHAAVEDVDIFIKDFTVEDIELDPLLIQLLKLPDIQTFLKKLCEEQDLKVMWTLSEFNNSITCHCKDRKAVQDFSDVLQHNLEKKTYRYSKQSFGDKAIIFSTTNMFSDFLKKYDGKRLVSTVEGNSMHIFTTRGIGNKLALLEVNFEGTKIDIQKNEKKEIHDQKSEVTITDDGIEWIDGTKRWLNVEDIFHVVRGKINPSLKLENEVRAECIKQNMKYDEITMEVEGTLEQLMSLRQYLITRFGVERGLVNIEQKQETLPRKMHQASHPNKQADDIERKSKIKLTDMEYKMLIFYCPESQVFKRKWKYENDMLIIYLGTNETEQEIQLTIQAKLTHFNSMTSLEVVPQDTTIDDDQLRKIEQEIPPDIFCYLSKDRKTLTFKGSNYEKLSVAKNKSEFILGLQKKNNNPRRNRVISIDPNYESRKDKTPENRSFHQSINYSRSSPESFSVSSRTYNSSAVKDLSYLTPEGLVVKVYVGSILHLNVDCIVNAANENLMHAAGVADVISRAAGYDFQKESDDYIQNNGPLSVTECCTTSAGNLQQYQCVIHAVGPKWNEYPIDKRACAYDLQKTIVNCFKEAEVQKVSSVALPEISSGIFGVPKEVCCSQYCNAVIEYSNTCGKTTCLKEIHFMDKEPGMIQMLHAEFSRHPNMTQSASASGNTGPNPSTGTTATWSRDGKYLLSRSFSDDPDIKHHHDNPSSGNSDANRAQTIVGKFLKQYIAAKDLRINIVQEDITKMTVDIIVWPQDDVCLSKEGIAQAIPKDINEWYRNPVFGKNRVKKCKVKEIKVSPASLPFKKVLHTVAPRWDNHAVKNKKKFEKNLKSTIHNIVQHCSDRRTINTVAIPVLGIGADGLPTPCVTYSSILANEISKAMKSDKFSLTEIYIVTHDWSMASAIADHFDTVDSFTKVPSFKGRNRKKDKQVVKAGDKEQSKDDL